MNRTASLLFVTLLLVVLGLLVAFHPPGLEMRSDRPMPWDVPLILAAALMLWLHYPFTRVHTMRLWSSTPDVMLTDGPHRYSRNPVFLGVFLLLLAGALFVNTWCALLVPFVFWIAAQFWLVPAHERARRARFGDQFDEYSGKVRRWF